MCDAAWVTPVVSTLTGATISAVVLFLNEAVRYRREQRSKKSSELRAAYVQLLNTWAEVDAELRVLLGTLDPQVYGVNWAAPVPALVGRAEAASHTIALVENDGEARKRISALVARYGRLLDLKGQGPSTMRLVVTGDDWIAQEVDLVNWLREHRFPMIEGTGKKG